MRGSRNIVAVLTLAGLVAVAQYLYGNRRSGQQSSAQFDNRIQVCGETTRGLPTKWEPKAAGPVGQEGTEAMAAELAWIPTRQN
jgi:hypothetical protein